MMWPELLYDEYHQLKRLAQDIVDFVGWLTHETGCAHAHNVSILRDFYPEYRKRCARLGQEIQRVNLEADFDTDILPQFRLLLQISSDINRDSITAKGELEARNIDLVYVLLDHSRTLAIKFLDELKKIEPPGVPESWRLVAEFLRGE